MNKKLKSDNNKFLTCKEKLQKNKLIAVILISVFSFSALCVYLKFGNRLLNFFKDTERFRLWLESFGSKGKIVFVLIRAIQTVVKFIPAEPLEIGSGYAFGIYGGLFYCMLGTLTGSLIIIILTKIFGIKIVNIFVSPDKINSLQFLQNKSKLSLLLFVIYLIPGTPKDIITYLIGLTDYSICKFLLLTSFARIPSIITSTICGATLEQGRIGISVLVFVFTALTGLAGIMIYKKLEYKFNKPETSVEA